MDVKTSAGLLVALLMLAVVAPLPAHPGSGLVVDRLGRVYFVLPGDSRIMRIDGAGNLITFVSDPRLRLPHHLVMDAAGNIFVASDHDGIIWKITPAGELTEFFSSQDLWRARVAIVGNVGDPFTMDAAGNIYCLNYRGAGALRGTSRILKITPEGDVSVFAGSDTGYADGIGAAARFHDLHFSSMAWGPDGRLYVTDRDRVRAISADGTVSTLVVAEGIALERGTGVTVDADGVVYVADYRAGHIVKITPSGEATIVPGSRRLSGPTGVATDAAGTLYVLDSDAFGARVWRLAPDGELHQLADVRRSGTAQLLLPLVLVLLFPGLLVMWMWRRTPTGPVDAIMPSVLVGIVVGFTWWGGGMMPRGYPLWYLVFLRHVILAGFVIAAVHAFLRTRAPASPSETA